MKKGESPFDATAIPHYYRSHRPKPDGSDGGGDDPPRDFTRALHEFCNSLGTPVLLADGRAGVPAGGW